MKSGGVTNNASNKRGKDVYRTGLGVWDPHPSPGYTAAAVGGRHRGRDTQGNL